MNSGNKGFQNLGNTCYMNSALQCLSHLLEFHPKNDNFMSDCLKCQNRSDYELMNQWIKLQMDVWDNSCNGCINPQSFLRSFIVQCRAKDKIFYNFNQNDVDEFLTLLMELLHESIKKKVKITVKGEPKTQLDKLAYKSIEGWKQFFEDDYSYIIKKFYSQLLTVTSCTECDYVTTNHEPLMVLSLEIPEKNSLTLRDCLDNYTALETLDCDNSWKCDKCKCNVEPERKIMLWESSDVLIILLKRFKNGRKNDAYIQFPLSLDIEDYIINYSDSSNNYALAGMCIQSGDVGGGHYYAMCKNNLDNSWHTYNDSSVSDVSEKEVLQQKPYCLFYRRV